MLHFAQHLLHEYGYGVITVLVTLECAGLLVPGETVFFGSAIYASKTGHLNIAFIVLATIAGAVLGNVLGFAIGRLIGKRVLVRYGWRIGLHERRLAVGRYLFRRHGGKVVFFSRFVSVLRSFTALLAGANGMAWVPFVIWTVAGGIAWPCAFGSFAYALGSAANRMSGRVQIGFGLLAVGLIVWAIRIVRRNESHLEELAVRSEAHEPTA